MRAKSIFFWMALLGWLAGTMIWWWSFVFPAPVWRSVMTGQSLRWTPYYFDVLLLSTDSNEMVRSPVKWHRDSHRTYGPLRWISPIDGREMRCALSSDDELVRVELRPRELAIVRRRGEVRVVSLADERVLFRMIEENPVTAYHFTDAGRVFVSYDGEVMTGFDIATGRQLWTCRNVVTSSDHGWEGCEVFNLQRRDPERRTPQGFPEVLHEIWNSRTGEIDPRLTEASFVCRFSEDASRFVAAFADGLHVFGPGQHHVRLKESRFDFNLQSQDFSSDGRQFRNFYRDEFNRHRFAIWDCETGAVVQPLPLGARPPTHIPIPGGKYSVLQDNGFTLQDAIEKSLPDAAEKIVFKLPGMLSLVIWQGQHRQVSTSISEIESGRVIGRCPRPLHHGSRIDEVHQRVANVTDSELVMYAFTTFPDLRWLAKAWLPALALAAALTWCRRHKRRTSVPLSTLSPKAQPPR